MLNKIILNLTYEFNVAKTVFTLHKLWQQQCKITGLYKHLQR